MQPASLDFRRSSMHAMCLRTAGQGSNQATENNLTTLDYHALTLILPTASHSSHRCLVCCETTRSKLKLVPSAPLWVWVAWGCAESKSFPSIWQCDRLWNVGIAEKCLKVCAGETLVQQFEMRDQKNWYTLMWLAIARYTHSEDKPTRLWCEWQACTTGNIAVSHFLPPKKKKIRKEWLLCICVFTFIQANIGMWDVS